MKILQPAGWPAPRGYAHGVVASGRQVVLAGQVGWNAVQQFESEQLSAQVRQALSNIGTLLVEAGAKPEHLVRLTWYVTSVEEYRAQLKEIGAAYRELMGRHFPPMSVVEVVSLVEPQAKVEIEATAIVPDR